MGFQHCVFSNEYTYQTAEKMLGYSRYTCVAFHQCVFSDAFSNQTYLQILCCISCNCKICLQCELVHEPSGCQSGKMLCHMLHTCIAFRCCRLLLPSQICYQ